MWNDLKQALTFCKIRVFTESTCKLETKQNGVGSCGNSQIIIADHIVILTM